MSRAAERQRKRRARRARRLLGSRSEASDILQEAEFWKDVERRLSRSSSCVGPRA